MDTRWNLKLIYPSINEWIKDLNVLGVILNNKTSQKHIIITLHEKVSEYYYRNKDTNNLLDDYDDLFNQINNLYNNKYNINNINELILLNKYNFYMSKIKTHTCNYINYKDSEKKKIYLDNIIGYKKYAYELNEILKQRLLNNKDSIDVSIVDCIKSYTFLFRKYINIRKKIINKKYYYYDLNQLFVEDTLILYNQNRIKKIINESLKELGENYLSKVQYVFDNNLINIGHSKRSYTCDTLYTPPYIYINYDDSQNSLRELAHEIGHAVNNLYKKENKYNCVHSEEFSKVNELLLDLSLISNTRDTKDKLIIYNNMLINIFSNIFGNCMITSFLYKCVNSTNCDYCSLYIKEYKMFYPGLSVHNIQKYNYLKIRDLFTNNNYFHYEYLISSLLSIKYRNLNKYFDNNTIEITDIPVIMNYINTLSNDFEMLVDKIKNKL